MWENTRYMQYAAVLSATIMSISLGTVALWPSPTLPLLTSPDSPIGVSLTVDEGAWIVSIPLLVSLPCAFLSGWLLDRFGRKYCLLASAIPMGAPWIIIIFAKSFLAVCIARALSGTGIILVMVGCPMYSSEIADNEVRGKISAVTTGMALIGIIVVLGIGPFISYVALALVCLAVPVIFFVTFVFMPESPFYLVKVGKVEAAKAVLVRISPENRDGDFVDKKIEEIRMSIEMQDSNRSSMSELFAVPEYRKALWIVLGVQTLHQLSGAMTIQPYLQTIMEETGTGFSPEYSSIIFGVVPIPAVFVSALLVDRLGRKPLLILSSIGSAVGLFAVGAYFYLKNVLDADMDALAWLPTTSIVFFLLMNSIGLSVLPFVILSEMFATNIKGMAMSVGVFYATILGFLLAKFFQPLSNEVGSHSVFWFFAASCVVGCFFVFFFVPETKGKPFAEIQRKLRNEPPLEGCNKY